MEAAEQLRTEQELCRAHPCISLRIMFMSHSTGHRNALDTPEQLAARAECAAEEEAGRFFTNSAIGRAHCVLKREAGRTNTRKALLLVFHIRRSHSCFLLPDTRKSLQGFLPSSSVWFSFAPAAVQHLRTVSDWRLLGARADRTLGKGLL